MTKVFRALAFLLLITCGAAAIAAPSISSVSASAAYSHNLTNITIAGTDFETKDHAAPHVWDDASGTPNTPSAVLDKWDGYWPDTCATADYNMQYRTIYRGTPMPNTHTTQYMAGVHNGTTSGCGFNVAVWKDITISEGMQVIVDWHSRADGSWVDGGVPQDGNYKIFGWSVQGSLYELPNNWYASLWSDFDGTCNSNYTWIINDDADGSGGDGINQAGQVFWGSAGSMPCPLNWSHKRIELKVAIAGTDGFIKSYANNVGPVVNYVGYLDRYTDGLDRSVGFEGFTRSSQNANNVRYFWGGYIDYEPAATAVPRVFLSNNATCASATLYEMQIPSAWSDTSITIKANLGGFSDSGTAYICVMNKSGEMNTTGFAVTLSAGGAPPPTILKLRFVEFDLFPWERIAAPAANEPLLDDRLVVNGN